MKKVLIILLGIMCILPITGKAVSLSNNYTNLEETTKLLGLTKNKKYDIKKDDVEIVLFYGSGCPHCHDFIKFLNVFDKEYNHINLKAYEVWDNTTNLELMQSVGKQLDVEVRGVPFIIIGKKYWMGYGASMEQELRDAIKTEYETPVDARESYFTTTKAGTTSKNKTTTTTKSTTTAIVTKKLTTSDIETNTYNAVKEENKEEKEESILSKYRYVFIAAWAIVLIVFGVIIYKSKKNNE